MVEIAELLRMVSLAVLCAAGQTVSSGCHESCCRAAERSSAQERSPGRGVRTHTKKIPVELNSDSDPPTRFMVHKVHWGPVKGAVTGDLMDVLSSKAKHVPS